MHAHNDVTAWCIVHCWTHKLVMTKSCAYILLEVMKRVVCIRHKQRQTGREGGSFVLITGMHGNTWHGNASMHTHSRLTAIALFPRSRMGFLPSAIFPFSLIDPLTRGGPLSTRTMPGPVVLMTAP
jgi:hypothetical protein